MTNHSPQMVDDRASKKEKKRKAAWLSPILGGIIGGGLVLGITPLLPQSQDTAANTQTQTASSEPAASDNFSTKQITNATNVADMVEDLEPTIVGVSNYQSTQNSFGLSGDQTEAEAGTGSGVIFKKMMAKKRTLLQITMLSKVPIKSRSPFMMEKRKTQSLSAVMS
ncbi:hypothetical protein BsIDN1_57900 [Bacillus safensis]|uniref:Serine protease n=1 Tax=Bacillus safensis TaxID=561879 RepID=A0A5S9MHP4_BACIA|nr:hypothetical protein BsIDN1_57900 [Bacillus safensis]